MKKPPLRKPGQLKLGDELTLKVKVTRIGRNTYDTADVVTFRIPGYDTPITIPASYLKED